MKSKSTLQQKLWAIDGIAMLFCLMVSAGVYGGLVAPMLSKRATLVQQKEQLTREEQKCSRLNSAVLAMRKRCNTLQEELETGAVQLDPTSRMNQRIAQLTALLQEHDLVLEDIQTLPAIAHRRCDLLPIRMVGTGNYPASTQFLNALYEELPDMTICNVSLSGAPGVPTFIGQFAFDLCWFAAPSQDPQNNEGERHASAY